ncbi:PREDICTED: sulfotransferase family cytosolic 2B member 1-like [Branchiostoma belcheri]|uniref:Sulfotransferase n=1 Tax=Branchiostoma belcheri TaxID=7741 RepID=A0A6P5AK29_BRABE|nr:PREDICTED: sulfotransferase family cytosolic 2B member 1-like [Branchiostoma belcheri]
MALSKQRPPYAEYKGILFTSIVPRESLEAMKTFEIRDGDVVIVSYPKSGFNWMYEIVHKILGGKKENSSPIGPEFWPPGQEEPYYIQLRNIPAPRLMGSHLQIQMAPPGLADPKTKVKVIVVMRNPKDVCVSYYYYRQKNPILKPPESWEQHYRDFLEGKVPFGDYFDHVLGWWQMEKDPHFLFVKYEDMNKDFCSAVKTLAAFLEKELTEEELARVLTSCSLESMRKTLAESETWRKDVVRKGIVGDWKNHFSAEESEKFDEKYRKRMEGSGLEFEFE